MSKHKRQASALQIIAAQNNGAKSRGPVTPEGRATAAKNAAKHNMCSKALVLTMEDEEKFAEHQQTYFDQFQPEGEIEFGLVTDMVVAKWRTWRLWTLETALYDVQMDKQMKMIDDTFKSIDETTRCAIAFQTLADESKALSLLLRYETSMRRMHEKALATLMKLQTIRKSEASPVPTATLPTTTSPVTTPLTSTPLTTSPTTTSPTSPSLTSPSLTSPSLTSPSLTSASLTKPRPQGSELTRSKPGTWVTLLSGDMGNS
jgi:hypothetical protein